jgi:MFS family permease
MPSHQSAGRPCRPSLASPHGPAPRCCQRLWEGLGGSALYTSAGIGALLGPPLAGFLVDATPSYQVAILTAVGLALVAWLIAALVPARRVTSDARVRG